MRKTYNDGVPTPHDLKKIRDEDSHYDYSQFSSGSTNDATEKIGDDEYEDACIELETSHDDPYESNGDIDAVLYST